MNIHLLLDTKNGYPFIAKNLGFPCKTHISPEYESNFKRWVKGSLEVLSNSGKDDLIICVYDFQAVLCYVLSKLTFRRRKLLAINVLLKDKATLRNRFARFLYKRALKSKDFVATVTTREYGLWLKDHCGLPGQFPVLNDVCYDSYLSDDAILTADRSRTQGYVFCGGRNGRDWQFLTSVARRVPDIQFKMVMPTIERQDLGDLPANVECKCDIDSTSFNTIMAGASIIALPLDTEAPAGLIVMFQSACMNKPLIVTSTVSTREYIDHGRGIAVRNEVALWVNAIRNLIEHPEVGEDMAAKLREYVTNECSEAKYVGRLKEIINTHFLGCKQ